MIKKKFWRLLALTLAAVLTVGCHSAAPEVSEEGSAPGDATSGASGDKTALGADPMKDPPNPQAFDGSKGSVYYLSWNSIRNAVGADSEAQYDALCFVTALQGVLNREEPTLYFDYQSSDTFWYKYMKREGKLLYGYAQTVIPDLDTLFTTFAEQIREYGLVTWDPQVPSTSNVAVTACGAYDYLPLRAGGAFTALVQEKTGAPVKLQLEGKFTGRGTIPGTNRASSGSAKCDAYLFALETMFDDLEHGVVGYYVDGTPYPGGGYGDLSSSPAVNRDYLIANRAFVFDLGPWDDELPHDDPGQPMGTDYRTLIEILDKTYQKNNGKVYTVMGYVPWDRKYTATAGPSNHSDVHTEWHFCEIISSFNAILDADSAPYGILSNASLYRHYPLKESYNNNHIQQKLTYDPNKQYVMLYLGDYDSGGWVKNWVPRLWTDPARGDVPMAWPFNLNLSDRIPMLYDYLYETKSDNDMFISGDSGAGYLFPSVLLDKSLASHSSYPSGEESFVEHCQKYFRKFDVNYIGFAVNPWNPFGEKEMAMYNRFAPRGTVYGHGGTMNSSKLMVYNNVPYMPATSDMPEKDTDEKSPKTNGDFILRSLQFVDEYPFYVFRTILWKPSEIKALQEYVVEKSGGDVVFCTPDTFSDLILQAWNG